MSYVRPIPDEIAKVQEVLKNQIKQRDEQLKQKDEQIRKKDEQINQFLERDRETNILLKGYQDRYLLKSDG